MSDNVNVIPGTNVPVPATEQKTQEVETVELSKEDGVTYLLAEFTEGEGKGLKYAFPRFDTVEAAVTAYTSEKVLDLLNSSLKTRIAAVVKNRKIPKNVEDSVKAKELQKLKESDPSGKGLIFTVDEAKAYKLGEREPGIKDMLAEGIAKLKAGEADADFLQNLLFKINQKSRKK